MTTDTENDFAKRETWERMRIALGDDKRVALGEAKWPTPSDDLLAQFGAYRDNVLVKTESAEYIKALSSAVYIAGQSRLNQQTISGFSTAKMS